MYSTVYWTVYWPLFLVAETHWRKQTCGHFNRALDRVRDRVRILIATIATVTIGVT